MKLLLQIFIFACLSLAFTRAGAGQIGPEEKLHLFTDRSFCASGDTVWIMLKLPQTIHEPGIVARVQLNAADGNLIRGIAVESKNGWASGYLYVPDSLSTGHYFVTANVLFWSRNIAISPVTNSLHVFNRFDENIQQLAELPQPEINSTTGIFKIETDDQVYKTGATVFVKLQEVGNFEIQESVISARLANQFEETFESSAFEYREPAQPAAGFTEKGGFLVSGRVTNLAGIIQSRALVTIIINGQSSYFDYCVTDSMGMFHFFLKNAKGEGDVIFQVFPAVNQKCEITLVPNSVQLTPKTKPETIMLTTIQTDFAENVIGSSFAYRMFNTGSNIPVDTFSMFLPDKTPFYGVPSFRVYPVEFIDLPDFREISRELLHGFQYRVRNGEITFRMLNGPRNDFFDKEPLRMLNGIPVFDNQLFVNLKSTDISHIDLVQSERIFGDLILNGAIDVALKDKSNAFIEDQPNVFRFHVRFLQYEKLPAYKSAIIRNNNEPDTRQVFLWEKTNEVPENFRFDLSDRKGDVIITVEGLTKENRYFKSSKTITVK